MANNHFYMIVPTGLRWCLTDDYIYNDTVAEVVVFTRIDTIIDLGPASQLELFLYGIPYET